MEQKRSRNQLDSEDEEEEYLISRSSLRDQKRIKYDGDDGDKKKREEEEEDQEDNEQPSTSKHYKITQQHRTRNVTCGNKTGILYDAEKMMRGEECIKSEGRRFNPIEFEIFGGKGKNRKWKHSIQHKGKLLQSWIDEGYFTNNTSKRRATVRKCKIPSPDLTSESMSEESDMESAEETEEDDGEDGDLLIDKDLAIETEEGESGFPPLLITHITGNTRDAASNTAYIQEVKEETLDTACPQRKLDDGCHDETEATTSGHDAAQLQVMETETRVPQASKSTPVSTSCNLDTMDLEQLKREKIKMKLKIMKLQEEYYTLKIREIKK
ncbi:hypothetical protein OYC64_006459 [Pagothenia borchgrevinki]|uniref:SAND domain-containing protein n=1 Tax=Pagothenia borchgrevinki TaxID=8213 RepID=A0ABD2GJC0_PAGBO